jgi:hypothetical protein
MTKSVTWLNLQYRNGRLQITVVILFIWLACFIKSIIGEVYTSWDTHDLGFVNFLYFSDSLRDGYIPFWNHFIQSGTFFPSFFNVGLFSPFQLFFVILSWVINPAYIYEIMLQSIILVGGVGAYLLFFVISKDKFVALFGATAFSVTVLVPITGQVMFLFSLSSFPWLIFFCMKTIISKQKGIMRYVFFGTLGAMYISSGYVWMNLVNIIITFFFLVCIVIKVYSNDEILERKSLLTNLIKLGVFFTTYGLLYVCLMLPGYLNLSDLYSIFSGDYINPEPRLRSLGAQPHYAYSSFLHALVGAIDPRIAINDSTFFSGLHKWSFGAGWVLWIIAFGVSTKKLLLWQAFWISISLVALLYSFGDDNFIGAWVEKIPLLNANRWWVNGIFYLNIAIVFLSVPKMKKLRDKERNEKSANLQLLLVTIMVIFFLVYFKSSFFEFILVSTIIFLIFLLGKVRKKTLWESVLFLLIGVNVGAIAYMPYSFSMDNRYFSSENGYNHKIDNREKSVVITENYRQLGKGNEYIYNDETWLLKKIPFSHGFNPLGNPWHWYLKNEPFISSFVVVTQKVRKEANLDRANFVSDNVFAQTVAIDVLIDNETPTIDNDNLHEITTLEEFDWKLNNLRIEPNLATISVSVNAAAYLIFNNVNSSGWSAYIDGKKVNIINTNRIFQGVYINNAGLHEVVFKYQPKLTVFLILLPYLVLMLCLVSYVLKRRKRGFVNC